jgi:uncharacterized protein (TIGR00725 family)
MGVTTMTDPSRPSRRPVVAIVGGARGSRSLLDHAESLGCSLVDAGYRVATGGLGGVMEAASRGARSAPTWRDGDIIGVLPGLDPSTANPWVDIAIPTGLNYARNVVLVSMADAVVAVGGGAGTLSEIALAWQHHKLVIAMDLGEGWSAKMAGETLDARRQDHIHRATSATEVLEVLGRLLPSWSQLSRGF